MKKHLSLLLLRLAFVELLFPQTLPNYTPPSPEAWQFQKYGEFPVNLNTGIPSINIPLYQMSAKEINCPISISYHAGGFKVKEISSSVGLGWTLQAGGVITRKVNYIPDDNSNGYYSSMDEYINDLDEYVGIHSINTNSISGDELALFCRRYFLNLEDLEPDEFYINTPFYNGKMIINEDLIPVLIPQAALDVSIIWNGSTINGFRIIDENGIIYHFDEAEITDINQTSIIYNSAFYLTRIENDYNNENIFFYYSGIDGNWATQFDYAVNLICFQDHYSYLQKTNENHVFDCIEPENPDFDPENPDNGYEVTTYFQKRLDSIVNSKYNESVIFNYVNDRIDVPPGNSNYRLESVLIKKDDRQKNILFYNDSYFEGDDYIPSGEMAGENDNLRLKLDSVKFVESDACYKFEYETLGLPVYSSYDVDHWGFYNYSGGYHNTSLIPPMTSSEENHYAYPLIGTSSLASANRETNANAIKACMLKKIVYPTSGITEFDYEANVITHDSIYDYLNIYNYLTMDSTHSMCGSELDMHNLYVSHFDGPWPIVKYHVVTLNENAVVKLSLTRKLTDPLFNGHYNVVYKKIPGYHQSQSGCYHLLDQHFLPIEMDGGIQIPLGESYANLEAGIYLFAALKSEAAPPDAKIHLSIEYSDNVLQKYLTKNVGGLRIKKIRNITENNISSKIFHYHDVNWVKPIEAPTGYIKSSGELFNLPNYRFNGRCRDLLYVTSYPVDDWGLPSDVLSNHIGYKEISIEEVNENETISNGFSYTEFLNDSRPEFRDLPSKLIYFNNNKDTIKAIFNNYYSSQNALCFPYIKSARIRIRHENVSPPCYHLFGEYPPPEEQCGRDVDFELQMSTTTSMWKDINEKIENEYFSNGLVSKKTIYDYAGRKLDGHLRATKIEEEIQHGDSSLFNIVTRVYYPIDCPSNISYSDLMADNYIIPVEIVKSIKNEGIENVFAAQKYKFLNKHITNKYEFKPQSELPLNLGEYNFSNEQPFLNIDEDIFYCSDSLKYNSTKNMTEYYTPSGFKSVLYGYNDTKIIAIAENAAENEIYHSSFENSGSTVDPLAYTGKKSHFLNSSSYQINKNFLFGNYILSYYWKPQITNRWELQVEEKTYSGTPLYTNKSNGFIDEVRIVPKNILTTMTTYTYDPLFGMTSQTDLNGIRTFYEYDSSGRLIRTRDHEHNILQEYKYNYATQNP